MITYINIPAVEFQSRYKWLLLYCIHFVTLYCKTQLFVTATTYIFTDIDIVTDKCEDVGDITQRWS
jgi:hypothetical protein